jgi:hypothetical protein
MPWNNVNKTFIRKWVAALRSGKFRQANGSLVKAAKNKHLKYCCLGVACKIAGLKPNPSEDGLELEFAGEDCYLPIDLATKIGIEKDPIVEVPSKELGFDIGGIQYPTLSQLNDDYNFNFKKIADVIEKEAGLGRCSPRSKKAKGKKK